MYDYMLQSFKGHTDQILHRSSGIFPSNDFYDFIRRRFPEPEHDQRRKRLLVIPAGDGGRYSIPILPLNSTMIFCAVFSPNPLTFLRRTAFSVAMIPCNSLGE